MGSSVHGCLKECDGEIVKQMGKIKLRKMISYSCIMLDLKIELSPTIDKHV
jgi:hypothetical protein